MQDFDMFAVSSPGKSDKPYGGDNLHFDRCADCRAFLNETTGINVCHDCRVSVCNGCILEHVANDERTRAERERERALCTGSTMTMFDDMPKRTTPTRARQRGSALKPERTDGGALFAPQDGRLAL